jgi:hypothetical protein
MKISKVEKEEKEQENIKIKNKIKKSGNFNCLQLTARS